MTYAVSFETCHSRVAVVVAMKVAMKVAVVVELLVWSWFELQL